MKKILILVFCCFTLQSYTQCYTSVSSKVYHNLAIKPDGTLWAWGDNSYSALGNNSNIDQPSAIQIGTATNWLSVHAGTYWSLALKTNGTLWAWGRNDYGQTVNAGANTPQQIGTDSDWAIATAGQSFGAAIKTDGTLWMWGSNINGQLGNGTTDDLYTPTQVGTDNNWIAVSLGSQQTLALKANGTLWAWGQNDYGNLGIGNFNDQYIPVQVGTDNDWVKICAGYTSSYAIKADGTLWAWGSNSFRQVGNGGTSHQTTPVQIGTSTWKSISATHHVLAIQTNGTLWSWGWNIGGQVGNGNPGINQSVPLQVGADSDWNEAVSGWHHSLAVKNNGTLWSWGDNEFGTLGDGTFTDNLTPTQVGMQCDQVLCTITSGSLPDFTSGCEVNSSDMTPPSMTDTCGNTIIPSLLIGSFPISEQGTTTIVWQYNTSSGQVTAQQNIIITNDIAPVPEVTTLADVQAQCEVDLNDLEAPQATANCGGLVSATTNASFPINTQGTTVIEWIYTDNFGNTSIQPQNIIIDDSVAPVPDTATLPVLTGECEVTGITPPTATDGCAGTITATTTDPLSYNTQGSYTITWTFDDNNGNAATQTQNVIVDDVTNPVVIAQTITVDLQGQESINITAEDIDNGSSDNCTVLNLNLDVDTFTQVGIYTVQLTGTDAGGNQSTVTAIVNVIDSSLGTESYSLLNIKLYPIPVKEWLFIEKPAGVIITKIEVCDMVGRTVYTFEGDTNKINLTSLNSSSYRLIITTNNGLIMTSLIKN